VVTLVTEVTDLLRELELVLVEPEVPLQLLAQEILPMLVDWWVGFKQE
jgi:hypothetical protein